MSGERHNVGPSAPMLINLPPPPSDPVTPSDMGPGTPNSTTTSMSELSTVAIKDGHRGHLHHHQQPLEAERADRISRLAGLERVAQPPRTMMPGGVAGGPSAQHPAHITQGYFDANNQPQMMRERSTVGSASATGSVGGRTTWASESVSDVYDPDKMSEDQEIENSSVGGFSDEGATSLVGFGEGARTPARQTSVLGSPVAGKAAAGATGAAPPPYVRAGEIPPRMIDGMTYDPDVVDTVSRTPPPTGDTDFDGDERGPGTPDRLLGERSGVRTAQESSGKGRGV